MKKFFILLLISAAFAACNEPSGDGAGNDTGTDTHNNLSTDTAAATTDTTAH